MFWRTFVGGCGRGCSGGSCDGLGKQWLYSQSEQYKIHDQPVGKQQDGGFEMQAIMISNTKYLILYVKISTLHHIVLV